MNTNKFFSFLILGAVVLVSGCATNPMTASNSQSAKPLFTEQECSTGGAIFGGLVGVLVGRNQGKTTYNTGVYQYQQRDTGNTMIGGALGALVGYAGGKVLCRGNGSNQTQTTTIIVPNNVGGQQAQPRRSFPTFPDVSGWGGSSTVASSQTSPKVCPGDGKLYQDQDTGQYVCPDGRGGWIDL